jgi:hypothetical protein
MQVLLARELNDFFVLILIQRRHFVLIIMCAVQLDRWKLVFVLTIFGLCKFVFANYHIIPEPSHLGECSCWLLWINKWNRRTSKVPKLLRRTHKSQRTHKREFSNTSPQHLYSNALDVRLVGAFSGACLFVKMSIFIPAEMHIHTMQARFISFTTSTQKISLEALKIKKSLRVLLKKMYDCGPSTASCSRGFEWAVGALIKSQQQTRSRRHLCIM